MAIEAELAFHPGATPLRALLAHAEPPEPGPGEFGSGGVAAALDTAARALAANPWLDEWPVALAAALVAPWTVSTPDGSLPLAPNWRAPAPPRGGPRPGFRPLDRGARPPPGAAPRP